MDEQEQVQDHQEPQESEQDQESPAPPSDDPADDDNIPQSEKLMIAQLRAKGYSVRPLAKEPSASQQYWTRDETDFLTEYYRKSRNKGDYTGLKNYLRIILNRMRRFDPTVDVNAVIAHAGEIKTKIERDEAARSVSSDALMDHVRRGGDRGGERGSK